MFYFGIDPGMTGAMARIGDSSEVKRLDYVWDCPSGEIAMFHMLNDALADVTPRGINTDRVSIAIENAHSRPGNAARAMFKYGSNWGAWKMACACFEIPLVLVSPQKWQNKLLVKSEGLDTKERALVAARRLFPHLYSLLSTRLTRKKDNGRADALLIAYWLREYHGKK